MNGHCALSAALWDLGRYLMSTLSSEPEDHVPPHRTTCLDCAVADEGHAVECVMIGWAFTRKLDG